MAAKGVGSLIDCRLNSTARGGIPNGRQAAVNAHNFLFQLHETKTEAASLCKSGGYHRFMCLHATTTRGSFGARVPWVVLVFGNSLLTSNDRYHSLICWLLVGFAYSHATSELIQVCNTIYLCMGAVGPARNNAASEWRRNNGSHVGSMRGKNSLFHTPWARHVFLCSKRYLGRGEISTDNVPTSPIPTKLRYQKLDRATYMHIILA